MVAKPDITHIIPAHNEELYLPKTLGSVERAAAAFAGTVEVIVVNNASTDRTAEVAQQYGARVIFEPMRCIAAVRNTGAAVARGRILTFADADSMVSENFFSEIHRQMSQGMYIGGNCAIRPDRTSVGIRLSIWAILSVIRTFCRVSGGSYFCLRETFEAIGGFDASRPCAEDVDFAMRLKKYGKARKLRYLHNRNAYVITSMRKADRYGDWHGLRYLLLAPLAPLFPGFFQKRIDAYFYDFDRSQLSDGFRA